MSDQTFKNNFYTLEDLEAILADISRLREHYYKNKHTLTFIQAIEVRENLAILNSELGEIGADLYYDKLKTDTDLRTKLLRRQEEIEAELADKKNLNPATGKPWTNATDRARYLAELECEPERRAADMAKRIHSRAFFLYSKTIPDILNTMASRISFLNKLTPQVTNEVHALPELDEAPRRNYQRGGSDDGFELWDVQRQTGRSMEEMENMDLDIEPEII